MDALARLLEFRVRVARLWRLDVWLHGSMLVAALAAAVWLRHAPVQGAILALTLLFSVLAHELGHCWAARRVGGRAREVVLWPLGGLAAVDVPPAAGPQLLVAASGPAVNLALALLVLPAYVAAGGGWPVVAGAGEAPVLATALFVNAGLALFNLVPAYPMDGGRILQAALWGRLGRERAGRVATSAALVTAGLLGAVALVALEPLSSVLAVVILAAMIGLAACAERQRASDAELARIDQDGEPDAGPRPGSFAAWRERRRLGRLEDETRRRAEMRGRLDGVLAKVSAEGLAALTREERRFLDQASAMLRQEQQSGRGR